jgi:hypothetical protein
VTPPYEVFGPPRLYLHQMGRAYRFRDRYAALLSGRRRISHKRYDDIEDFLWAAFLNTWHVKDWVRHDPTLPVAVAKKVVGQAEKNPALLVAADLANATKHVVLDKPRLGAHDGAIQIVTGYDGSITVHHVIKLKDGTQLLAIDALNASLGAWVEILRRNSLEHRVENALKIRRPRPRRTTAYPGRSR